jgi:hypothetical protein
MGLIGRVLEKAFEIGIQFKIRHERKKYTGIRLLLLKLYAAAFILYDVWCRNTLIVIQFETGPALETVSSFVDRWSKTPPDTMGDAWRHAKALWYRECKILPIDPEHF